MKRRATLPCSVSSFILPHSSFLRSGRRQKAEGRKTDRRAFGCIRFILLPSSFCLGFPGEKMAPTRSASSNKATVARPPRVLVVDDEAEILDVITDTVAKRLGCRVIVAKNIAQARKALETQRIDLLVTDVNLPDGDGMELLPILALHQPQAQAIVITGDASMDGAIEAMRGGAGDFLPKPFSGADLTERVQRA